MPTKDSPASNSSAPAGPTVPQNRPWTPASAIAMGRAMQATAGEDKGLATYGAKLESGGMDMLAAEKAIRN